MSCMAGMMLNGGASETAPEVSKFCLTARQNPVIIIIYNGEIKVIIFQLTSLNH